MILRFFFHFDKIMSNALILYLIGKNFRCFLLIVVPVTGVYLFIVLWLVFHNWVYWTRGNLLASWVMYISASCAFPLRGVPGRHEYIWSLCWAGWRAGTGFLSFWLLVSACVCVIEQVGGGGVAVQYDFSSILCFVLAGQYD